MSKGIHSHAWSKAAELTSPTDDDTRRSPWPPYEVSTYQAISGLWVGLDSIRYITEPYPYRTGKIFLSNYPYCTVYSFEGADFWYKLNDFIRLIEISKEPNIQLLKEKLKNEYTLST